MAGVVVDLLLPDTVPLAVLAPVPLHLDHGLGPAQLVVCPTGVGTEALRVELVDPQGGGLEPLRAWPCNY